MKRELIGICFVAATAFVVSATASSAEACSACGAPCGYTLVEKVVRVPTMVPEMRTVYQTHCRQEERERQFTVYRHVPETRQVKQVYTVMVPQQRVRQVKYYVQKPVWEERDQHYVVHVPHVEQREGVRSVCRPVQVQAHRTICRDAGHWDYVTQTVPCGCHGCGCGGCGGCGYVTQTCKVWRPNIITEKVPVTVLKNEIVQEKFHYNVTVHTAEKRVRRVKVCRYVPEERVRDVSYTVCVPAQRERLCNVTTYRTVAEQRVQKYYVSVPYQVQKQVQVMVCRMVPKTVVCKVPCY